MQKFSSFSSTLQTSEDLEQFQPVINTLSRYGITVVDARYKTISRIMNIYIRMYIKTLNLTAISPGKCFTRFECTFRLTRFECTFGFARFECSFGSARFDCSL